MENLDLNRIYVFGNGRISAYLSELGIQRSLVGQIPKDALAIIFADYVDKDSLQASDFRKLAELSLECANRRIPLIFVSDESVFGGGFNFLEGEAKNPTTDKGLVLLACEAIVRYDGHKTVRVQTEDVPSGMLTYLKKFPRVPQTLHLGSGGILSVSKSRSLGIYDQ